MQRLTYFLICCSKFQNYISADSFDIAYWEVAVFLNTKLRSLRDKLGDEGDAGTYVYDY
jgi:hypothetical protein